MHALSRIFRKRGLSWPAASLRTYLVAMTLAATIPLAALMSYQIVNQIRSHDDSLNEGLQRSAALLTQAVNRELTSSIDALTLLSYAAEIQQNEPALFEEALVRRPLARQSWSGVYLRTLPGQILFDTSRPRVGQLAVPNGGRPTHHSPDQKVFISNLQSERATGGFVTSVEVPVTIDGVQRYVLGARIRTPVWQQLVAEAGAAAPDVLVILDRDFRLIARSANPESSVGKLIPAANRPIVASRPTGTARLLSVDVANGHNYSAWDRVPVSGWTVAVGMRAGPIDVARGRAQATALATVAACLLLGVILALLVSRQMALPLQRLARGDFTRPATPIVVHELAQLRDALASAREQDETTRELIRKKRDLLRKKADEFEAMLTNCPIGLAIANDRNCSDVKRNQAMKTLLGLTPGTHYRFAHIRHQGVDLPRAQQPLQRAAMLGESTFGMELELSVEGKPPSFVIVNAVPLLDERGVPRGAISAMVDITGRKAAEERQILAEQRLRQSQHLIDLAQETGHVGFFHYRMDEQKLAWTPGQATLFGISRDEASAVLTDWVCRINHSDWRGVLRALLKAFAAGRQMVSVNYCIHLPDKSIRCLSSRMKLTYGPDVQPLHIIGVTVDMTEQVKAERERDELIVGEQAARREAEAANRAKDEFLAMLGHELRNPLSAISSGIEVLNRVDGDSEVGRNARRIIDRQTRHLAHMMDDLLDVGRVLTGQRLPRSELALGALVQRVIATLQIAGQFRDHELRTEIGEVWIHANATRIEQVISNLLINALKYTPPGGRIVVRVAAEDGRAVLTVEDNGVGIPKELLPRVFDLFVQGERSLDRRSGGLGVGLTLVRRLVELHEGHISVRDADPGTIMCVSLPAIDAPAIPDADPAAPRSRARHVVVIEDNEDLLDGLRTMLSLASHTVWTCTDGAAGVDMILARHPDVAIVDVGLPGLTGYEVAQRVRAAGFSGKLLALSGYGQERDRQQASAAGFDQHFLKPAQISELLEAIDKA